MIKKVGKMFLVVALIVLAVISFSYFNTILAYAGPRSSMLWLWPLLSLVFAGLAVLLIADAKFDFINKWPKWPLAIVTIIFACGLLLFTFLYSCVLSGMRDKPSGKVDYIIVLGAQIKGTRPSRSLAYRLDGAIDYYQENKNTTIVVSGGQGPDEVTAEAYVMKDYLLAKGIPEEAIIVEDKSTTTNENLKFSKALIEERSGSDYSVAICSNNFHIFRAKALARKIGYNKPQGLATRSDSVLIANYMIRDSLAILKEKMLGNI